ncbi:MAG TPA: hypothetical protein VKE70_35610, partial [Candidatus Solibacter sp.]|nr:hypothetical protein [Candidatus Solibacter sp.]
RARAEIAFRRAETEGEWGLAIWKNWQESSWPVLEIGNDGFAIAAPPHWEASLSYVREIVTGARTAVSSVYGTSGGLQRLDGFLSALTDATAKYVYDTKLHNLDSGDQQSLYACAVYNRKPDDSRAAFVYTFVLSRLADTLRGLVMQAWSELATPGQSGAGALAAETSGTGQEQSQSNASICRPWLRVPVLAR